MVQTIGADPLTGSRKVLLGATTVTAVTTWSSVDAVL